MLRMFSKLSDYTRVSKRFDFDQIFSCKMIDVLPIFYKEYLRFRCTVLKAIVCNWQKIVLN